MRTRELVEFRLAVLAMVVNVFFEAVQGSFDISSRLLVQSQVTEN